MPLSVSSNGRFLVHDDGGPFFYLGDTAWELFHRCSLADAEFYLRDRAAKGFTVIQAVALAELDGLNTPNANGDTPLIDTDPLRPNEAYWRHVDAIVALANELGLVVGFLPTWGSHWKERPIFTADNAYGYAAWLAKRYRDANLIWILGGDRSPETEAQREIIRAFASGLREHSSHLITYHTQGAAGSAEYWHAEPWLDFNFRQNGHTVEYNGRYERTRTDYDRTPIKPVMDGEPVYEGIGIDFQSAQHGFATAADVRRTLYWNLFSGAFGATYGHNSVWQMYEPPHKPMFDPLMTWREALSAPGAGQMQHARRLLESRPFLTRLPDQSLLVPSLTVPGAGRYYFAATRDVDHTYAMVYCPCCRPFTVRFPAKRVAAWWFNPRNGQADRIGAFDNPGELAFNCPDRGETIDWILVLDDAAANYPAPGATP